MRSGRVADTTVRVSEELVEALLHVFHPLLISLADALANATAVTPREVTAQGRAADYEPQCATSCLLEGETGDKAAAASTPNTQDTTGAQISTAGASLAVSQGAVRTSSPVALGTARDSTPLRRSPTGIFSAAEEDEVGSHLCNGGNSRGEARQGLPGAPVKDELVAPRGAFAAEHCDDGRNVDGDAAKAAVAALCRPDKTESVTAFSPSHSPSLLIAASPSVASNFVSSLEVPATRPRKRGRPPLGHTVVTRFKREAPAHIPEEDLACASAVPLHFASAARPFCFTVSNAVLWEAVAALAEATLIDGPCFSWLQGEVRRRTETEQRRGKGQRSSKTVSSLPSPARMLADALLCFPFSSASIAHRRWRESTAGGKGEACPRTDGAREPQEGGSGETGFFGTLPTELQDAVFISVSVALMRAAAVHTAQLLSPLCVGATGHVGCAQSEEPVSRQRDAPTPALSRSDSHSSVAPSRATAHVAPFGYSEAQSHPQAECGCGEAPAPFVYLQQWAEGGWVTETEGAANAARTPVTFRVVQEQLKDRNRRTLQAQQQQLQHQLQLIPASATVSYSPTSVAPATAAAVTLRASSSRRGSLFAATAKCASSASTAGGQPPWCVADALLGPLIQQAEANDHSCFYVQLNTGDCDSSARTAVCATEFTVQVLCSALASAMTDEAAAATLRGSVSAETSPSAGAAGSSGVRNRIGGANNEQNDKDSDSHCFAGDARYCLVRQWCAGLEQLAGTTSALSTWSGTSRRRAPCTRQSSFTVSAAALFAYLRDSSVNPQIGLLADYALETGKATLALSKTPNSSARDLRGGHVATAGPAAATVDGAAHQPPWTTARWSVRPVVEAGEVDYVVGRLTSSSERGRGHPRGVNALSSLSTDSAADAYSSPKRTLCATIDSESPQADPPQQRKAHAHHVAPTSPLSRPAVEWLLLSDTHGHPLLADQAEADYSAPPPRPPSTTQVVETSTAELFQRVLGLTLAAEKAEVRASADVLDPLEEVGAVLATIDAVCAARTLVDTSAWRYGRNRMSVAAVSVIELTVSDGDSDVIAARGNGDDLGKCIGGLDRARDAPQGVPAGRAVLPSAEEDRSAASAPACRARVPLGLYHHECGVLYVADGATYALEIP
ncbi:hypothetical protein GH5_06149 [Leishmania sp. Ghana 2012 LV757]|uniref:hypothetical protein n=1 Tax=Leishmania sp. Ghana 2012 LV757 TaxID=2803181 RepID=UPI001B5857E2|nr:hypothetical protein GH5_06149 [Leishmania sp. Ghana 2012 LV757]